MIEWSDTCAVCGKELPLDAPPQQRYCSADCRKLGNARKRAERLQREYARLKAERLASKRDRPCEWCGAVIPASALRNKKYCSAPCRGAACKVKQQAAWRAERLASKHDRACEACGANIPASAKADKRFCSALCCSRTYWSRQTPEGRERRARYMAARREKWAKPKAE